MMYKNCFLISNTIKTEDCEEYDGSQNFSSKPYLLHGSMS